eukprot:Sspe_Gene.768::Locus_258_Transcript_2_2_Confidence_0.600_Length_1522::g.768::m.768
MKKVAVLLFAAALASAEECVEKKCPEDCRLAIQYIKDFKTSEFTCEGQFQTPVFPDPEPGPCHTQVQEAAILTTETCGVYNGGLACYRAGTCVKIRQMSLKLQKCICPLKEGDLCFSQCSTNECVPFDLHNNCPTNTRCRTKDRYPAATSKFCIRSCRDRGCAEGEACDPLSERCVVVSCKAKDPCSDGLVCKHAARTCEREPCSQYECVRPCTETGCAEGEECDDTTGRCMVVSCNAKDPCPSGQICIDRSLDCETTPCPQMECREKCTKGSCASGEECDVMSGRCIAISCSAPRPCDVGNCIPRATTCAGTGPCPQFTCVSCMLSKCGTGEECDPIEGKCVVVDCTSPKACVGKTCVKGTPSCERAPCPRFTCQ